MLKKKKIIEAEQQNHITKLLITISLCFACVHVCMCILQVYLLHFGFFLSFCATKWKRYCFNMYAFTKSYSYIMFRWVNFLFWFPPPPLLYISIPSYQFCVAVQYVMPMYSIWITIKTILIKLYILCIMKPLRDRNYIRSTSSKNQKWWRRKKKTVS